MWCGPSSPRHIFINSAECSLQNLQTGYTKLFFAMPKNFINFIPKDYNQFSNSWTNSRSTTYLQRLFLLITQSLSFVTAHRSHNLSEMVH